MKRKILLMLCLILAMSITACNAEKVTDKEKSKIEEVKTLDVAEKNKKEEVEKSADVKEKEEGWTWELSEDGVLTVEGTEEIRAVKDGAIAPEAYPWYEMKESVKKIVIKEGITGIAAHAFGNMSNLSEVTISEGVEVIGDFVFKECTNLAAITLPDSLLEIGQMVFDNCTNLRNITIPEKVKKIGLWAFQNCMNLEEVTIPGRVVKIESYIFRGCTNLKSVTFGEGVRFIDHDVFEECVNLETIYLPKSLREIWPKGIRDEASVYYNGTKEEYYENVKEQGSVRNIYFQNES